MAISFVYRGRNGIKHPDRDEKGGFVMRRAGFTLWALTFLLTYASDTMEAQTPNDLYCAVTLEGPNRNRTVAGAVNVECGFDTEPHTAPFGNWGVNSFYGRKKDTDQFRVMET